MDNDILESVLKERLELTQKVTQLNITIAKLEKEKSSLLNDKKNLENIVSDCEKIKKQYEESLELAQKAKENYYKLYYELLKYKNE